MSKKIYIIAGETSGDKIGAHLATVIKKHLPQTSLIGMGGQAMKRAGVNLHFDISHYAYFGFKDTLLHIKSIFRLRRDIIADIQKSVSDVVIFIDYPGLNLSLLRAIQPLGIKTVYYVCPKVWASREYRVKRLQDSVDLLWSIFPFEQDYFKQFGLQAHYVGHPLLEAIGQKEWDPHALPKKVVLMPGSRRSEIKKHAPVMCAAALALKKQYDLDIAIAMANVRHNDLLCDVFSPLISKGVGYIKQGDVSEEHADYAIAASGTVTLELTKRKIPMCVIYRLDRFSYWLAKKIVKVPYISLCNLIANAMVVPEFVQKKANASSIVSEFDRYYQCEDYRKKMHFGMQAVLEKMGGFHEKKLVATLESILDTSR